MKILITGICGFAGSTLAGALRDSHPDWEIVGIDNFSRPGSWLNRDRLEMEVGVQLFHGDIRSQTDVDLLPACDWVLDAAANASVLAGVDGKTSARQLIENNLFGTINLLEYCKRHQAGFILLSTSRVYSIGPLSGLKMRVVEDEQGNGFSRDRFMPDEDQAFPVGISPAGISEAYSTQPPVSLYGSTKVTSEHLALEYGETFGFPVWINRCGVMAGAGQFGHPAQGIFAFWIHSFREGRPLKYIGFDGHGRQVRDCLHPRDLVPLLEQQMMEPLQTDKPRLVNTAGGESNSMSLAELTECCQKRFPSSPTGEPVQSPEQRKFDLAWMVLDSTLATNVWDWRPVTPVASVIEEIATFADDRPHWLAVAK
jgi:CDP-paratose 2-epimerase